MPACVMGVGQLPPGHKVVFIQWPDDMDMIDEQVSILKLDQFYPFPSLRFGKAHSVIADMINPIGFGPLGVFMGWLVQQYIAGWIGIGLSGCGGHKLTS